MVEPNSHHAQHPDWIIFGVNTKLPPAPNIPELIIFHPKRYWQQNCIQTQTQTSQIKQLFHCSTTIPQILTSNYLPWNVDHPLQKQGFLLPCATRSPPLRRNRRIQKDPQDAEAPGQSGEGREGAEEVREVPGSRWRVARGNGRGGGELFGNPKTGAGGNWRFLELVDVIDIL